MLRRSHIRHAFDDIYGHCSTSLHHLPHYINCTDVFRIHTDTNPIFGHFVAIARRVNSMCSVEHITNNNDGYIDTFVAACKSGSRRFDRVPAHGQYDSFYLF